jgi:hypothetical protein
MSERQHYLQILQSYDDPDRWETPAEFNYYASRNRFLALAKAVQERLKIVCRVETDSLIQDASFIGQIMFPEEVLLPREQNDYGGMIRVSNFGNMATVTDERLFPAPMLSAIKQVMDEFDYVYIPPWVLKETYTGSNPGVTGIATWWIRYFDWV